ncbi:hypothetical protein C7M84_018118 [Penaeus vannamei]|uniref:Uncharacterized protein n=1 Tax=Penaeus vannamei TaxID=6689 RepID=A0A423SIK3_PENVA|nr:hypothetical protein C7M84_018118 [Penaeus vannamei]
MRPCPSKHGRSPGGTGKGAGSEHAGLAGWFGRLRGSASPAFRHVNPTLGPNGWQAGMAGAGARGGLAIRANSDGRESKPSTSSGNVRTRTCVPPGEENLRPEKTRSPRRQTPGSQNWARRRRSPRRPGDQAGLTKTFGFGLLPPRGGGGRRGRGAVPRAPRGWDGTKPASQPARPGDGGTTTGSPAARSRASKPRRQTGEWAGGPAPTAAAAAAAAAGSRRGSPPAARSRGSPPVVVGAGPQPTRPRAGAARPRGPRKAAPPTAPAARTPPKPAPLSGTGAGKAGADKTTYDSKPPEERHTQWGPGRNSRCKARLRRQASKQAQTGAGRRRASQARGKGEGRYSRWPSLLFNLPHPWAPQEEGRGIAGGFFLSRRKGVHTRDLTPRYRRNVAEGRRTAQPSRGEGRKRGAALGNHSERQERGGRLCEGQDHSRHWRGWHGDWLPRRPPVGIVARARDLCCARFGGEGNSGKGPTPELTKSTGRSPNPKKTPHTPGPNTTANRGPSCATPRERTPSARPGKRLTLSRVEGGEQRAPSRRLRPRPERAQGAGEPKPPARGARPNQQDAPAPPAQGPRPAHGELAARSRRRWSPYSCRRGPSATRPRAGAARPRGPRKAAPPTAPAARTPQSLPRFRGREPERQGLPRGGRGHARRPPPPPPAREGAGGRRGKGKGSPSRQTGEWAGPAPPARAGGPAPTAAAAAAAAGSRRGSPPARSRGSPPVVVGAGPQPHTTAPRARPCPSGRGNAPSRVRQGHARIPRRRPRPERAPGADGGKPEPTPVLRKTRQAGQARPGPAALGPRRRGGPKGQGKAQAVPWPAKDVAERPRWAGRRAARPLRPGGGTGGPSGRRAAAPAAATQQAKGGARLRRPALPAPPGSPLRHPRPRTQPPLPIVGGAGPQPTRPETGPSIRPAGAGAWRALGGTAPGGAVVMQERTLPAAAALASSSSTPPPQKKGGGRRRREAIRLGPGKNALQTPIPFHTYKYLLHLTLTLARPQPVSTPGDRAPTSPAARGPARHRGDVVEAVPPPLSLAERRVALSLSFPSPLQDGGERERDPVFLTNRYVSRMQTVRYGTPDVVCSVSRKLVSKGRPPQLRGGGPPPPLGGSGLATGPRPPSTVRNSRVTSPCMGTVRPLGSRRQPKKEKKALPRATAGVGERVRLLPSTHTGLRTTGSKEIQRGLPARPRTLFCSFSLPKALPEAVAVEANRQTPRPTRPQQAGREGEILFHAGFPRRKRGGAYSESEGEVVVHTVTVRGSPSPQRARPARSAREWSSPPPPPRGGGVGGSTPTLFRESPLTEGEREEGRRDRDGSSGRISRRRRRMVRRPHDKTFFPTHGSVFATGQVTGF